jgi:choline dehydrogenase-like flavoprotein
MLLDARTLDRDQTIQTDVCIVGSGAAGITLAREFRNQPFRVCLLEGGDLEADAETQSLYDGEIVGLPYTPLTAARLHYFGGTTNHWGGLCQPLDKLDFQSCHWIPHSGWPFDSSHLLPFYKRAQDIVQVGPFAYGVEAWEDEKDRRLPFMEGCLTTKMVQFSPPTRFGQVYRNEIMHAKNIQTYLNANVTKIETSKNARIATRVHVARLQGGKFWVSARLFILATGGIENARLLLVSNKVQEGGLGNQYDLVGRFFMDHALVKSGFILLSDASRSMDVYLNRKLRNYKASYLMPWTEKDVMGQLIPTAEIIHAEKLGNFCVLLEKTQWSEAVKSDNFLRSLSNVIQNIDGVVIRTFRKLFNTEPAPQVFRLSTIVAPMPNRDTRVELAAERDSLGENRVKLRWRMSTDDVRTIRRAQEIVGTELGRAKLGRLMVLLDNEDQPSALEPGHHHMETTRMHVDPRRGVVDADCKVHGIANVFVAGSSVFPTYGYAQPTLTILALALRLADHVKGLLA